MHLVYADEVGFSLHRLWCDGQLLIHGEKQPSCQELEICHDAKRSEIPLPGACVDLQINQESAYEAQ